MGWCVFGFNARPALSLASPLATQPPLWPRISAAGCGLRSGASAAEMGQTAAPSALGGRFRRRRGWLVADSRQPAGFVAPMARVGNAI